jgi:acyl-CoA reductase-like NAD-dependent aldehyde dehydrogenase
MKIESEETFGPVVAIDRFGSLDDAIKRANDSVYGLGAVVFGERDAKKVAQQLQAGMIGINQGVGAGGDAPWVGAKQSGFGFHGSVEGHRQFTQVTVINH